MHCTVLIAIFVLYETYVCFVRANVLLKKDGYVNKT